MTAFEHGTPVRVEFDATYYSGAFMGSHIVDADRDHRCTVPANAVHPYNRNRVAVELPEPTAVDNNDRVWHVAPTLNGGYHEVSGFVDRLGRPVVMHRSIAMAPVTARQVAAAMLAAADLAEHLTDQHAQAQQDAEETEQADLDVLLRTAAEQAQARGHIDRAERFETAATDHVAGSCSAGSAPCQAVEDARKALADYAEETVSD